MKQITWLPESRPASPWAGSSVRAPLVVGMLLLAATTAPAQPGPLDATAEIRIALPGGQAQIPGET